MAYPFNSILVPVDFSINTEVAVAKALGFADAGAVIHLIHVQTGMFLGFSRVSHGLWTNAEGDEVTNMVEAKLRQWKTSMEESRNDISVCNWISTGVSVQEVIQTKADELNVDLIIVGKSSHHSLWPFLNTVVPSRLAETTGKVVLTVKPGAIYNKPRSIVVPATANTCEHKMKLLAALCRKMRIEVHLVTFINESHQPADFSTSSLLQMFHGLKNNLQCPVDYAVLHGNNKAKAILRFAEKIEADILLLHPVSETKIGWMNKHISDVLAPDSKLEVLTC